MLNIYTANRIELLIAQLAVSLREQPLTSPFSPEVIAVNNKAMQKWLRVTLSQIHGVEANYHFPLPAQLLWSLIRKAFDDLPQSDPLDQPHLQWQIFTLLPELIDQPEFEAIQGYIRNDKSGIKRWQLAVKIADVFDRYQYYRPDWTEKVDDENQWQLTLWQAIIERIPQHKIAMVQAYLEQLADTPTDMLPERINFFAPSALPNLVTHTLLAISEVTEVNLYLLAPTDQYWLDLVSEKKKARVRLKTPEDAVYMETGNRLLSSWGRQGQIFFDQIISASSSQEYPAFQEPETDSVLQQVKRDIFDLADASPHGEKQIIDQDQSIALHNCHSALREVQVLHDQLLDFLNNDDAITPEDILVVAPDITVYTPYIEAVFRKSDSKPFVPWNISDTRTDQDIPLIRVFLQLFHLADSRFGRSEVLDYLDVPEVQQKFNLNEEDVQQLHSWLDMGNVRWGKNAEHKNNLGLPSLPQNTWAQLKDRLFMGYALGQVDELFGDISPVPEIEGNNSEALGKFWQLYNTLEQHSQKLIYPHTLKEWQEIINQLLDCFFDDSWIEESHLQLIRDAIDEIIVLAEPTNSEEKISRQLIRTMLEDHLSEAGNLNTFMSGGVSFSGFKPMRNLPFKVIAMLGMNDSDFPRRTKKIEFDLMQTHYQAGDPNSRDEDRYLFLETLLSAKNHLHISYIGRSLKDNTEKQAAVLVKELSDYLDIRFSSPDAKKPYSQHITQEHRLQAYHPSYFSDKASYDSYWCETAKQIRFPKENIALPWGSQPLPEADENWRDINLDNFIRFFKHPIRFFFQKRLGIYLNDETLPVENDELFELNHLEKYKIKQRLIREWLENRQVISDLDHLHAEGKLPHGKPAKKVLEEINETISPLLMDLDKLLGKEQQQMIAVNIPQSQGNWQITGTLGDIYPKAGLVFVKPGKVKDVDRLEFWIRYTLYRLTASNDFVQDAHLLGIDYNEEITSDSIQIQDLEEYLEELLGYYWQGIHQPLEFLPKCSAIFNKKKKKTISDIEESSEWKYEGYQGTNAGDIYDPYIQLAMRNSSDLPIHTEQFKTISKSIYRFIAEV